MNEQLDLFAPEAPDGEPAAPGDAPPDRAARERIATDLDATLFVEAGAGAGKTTALVGRIVGLVRSGVPIGSIAAITFTEKAAAELRARVRSELTLAALHDRAARLALDELDRAPIGTLHGFARRILFEFPIEAGLPPGFSVLDELESVLAFDEAWEDLLAALLDDAHPPGGIVAGGEDFVVLCEHDGFRIGGSLRSVADDFRANWDLVDAIVDRSDPGPPAFDLDPVVGVAERIVATPVPPDDNQATHVAAVRDLLARLRAASDLRSLLVAVAGAPDAVERWQAQPPRVGNKAVWTRAGFAESDLVALRELEHELGTAFADLRRQIVAYRKRVVGVVLAEFVLAAASERARTGRLEFHDLLVLTRRLVATRPDVRTLLHGRYTHLLLDEFQDTDPIQLEIAVRLAASPGDPHQASDWRRLVPLPGRLFVVGDPKQSIYRFRRADIAEYLRAADQVGADQVVLDANFRSTRAVIGFVNDVFGRLIEFVADTQPRFTALTPRRAGGLLDHGSVRLLGAEPHDDLTGWSSADHGHGAADELRRREAADVVAAVSTALAEGWPVGEPGDDDRPARTRPCRPSDICVLLPTRLPLPALERELAHAGIPYRAENSSVVYTTSEVRHLLGVLRAADDPTDQLALVAALRSPLYGCSDIELFEWVRAGGRWNLWAEPPEQCESHPVADALAHVRSVAERIGWTQPADLLAAVADERRAFDLALDGPDTRDVWRRLRYVIDQARAWADAGGHGVRRYLAWATLQAAANRVADALLPEHDHDVVRVMTVHAAKGLEFPVTIVAGLTTQPMRPRSDQVVWCPDDWLLVGRGDDGGFETHRPIDETMSDAERRRLLYVACTRAVDHLVVSLHRGPLPANNADAANWSRLTSAQLLWAAGASEPTSGADADPVTLRVVERPRLAPLPLEWADHEVWSRERRRTLATAARRRSLAATRLAEEVAAATSRADDPGLDKHPVNVDLPPWQRGRYGTSIGRAVHGVLQFCDLASGDDIDALAASQCAAEGVLGRQREVAALARSALAAPIVRHAAGGAEHRRELFVAAPLGTRVVEGYVDLLVRTDRGLVIVDYKTDQWSGPQQTAERIERYRIQLAAYGAALGRVLDTEIAGGILVRCRAGRDAEQIEIPRWAAALTEVEQLIGLET